MCRTKHEMCTWGALPREDTPVFPAHQVVSAVVRIGVVSGSVGVRIGAAARVERGGIVHCNKTFNCTSVRLHTDEALEAVSISKVCRQQFLTFLIGTLTV